MHWKSRGMDEVKSAETEHRQDQFLWLRSRQQMAKIDTMTMTIGEHYELWMNLHIKNIAQSCFYQLRQLRSIRRSLSTDAAKTLVHSLISSRVDILQQYFLQTLSWENCNLSSMRLQGWSRKRGSLTISLLWWGTNSTGFPSVNGSNSRSRSSITTPSLVKDSRSDIPQRHL